MNALFGFSGRLRRRYWWLGCTILVVIGVALNVLPRFLLPAEQFATDFKLYKLYQAPGIIFAVFAFWPYLALGAKRLHDQGRSALWLFGPYSLMILPYAAGLIPFLGAEDIAALAASMREWGPPTAAAALVGGAWAIAMLGILPGSPAENQYGPPRRTSDAVDVSSEKIGRFDDAFHWVQVAAGAVGIAAAYTQRPPALPEIVWLLATAFFGIVSLMGVVTLLRGQRASSS